MLKQNPVADGTCARPASIIDLEENPCVHAEFRPLRCRAFTQHN